MQSLRGEAEAAIGVEDWFGAIQALQAALSLAPNNFEISARLKWANDQRKLSGLFTEAQELYDRGKKAAALQKFRQVRVAGGNYRGVNELIAQLEREVSTESRRSTVRRWTFGTVAAVAGVFAVIVALVVMQIRSEFASSDDSDHRPRGSIVPADDPHDGAGRRADPRSGVADAPPARAGARAGPPPARDRHRVHAGRALSRRQPRQPADGVRSSRSTPNSTFQVQASNGIYNVPLSGGSFAYDPSSGMLLLSGMNNVGGLFSEPMQVYERARGSLPRDVRAASAGICSRSDGLAAQGSRRFRPSGLPDRTRSRSGRRSGPPLHPPRIDRPVAFSSDVTPRSAMPHGTISWK